uniref:Uncharacterized protein n=1 Tax=Plectus sambesii TaxID=2011161 RepID=A0A914X4F2_9BILA
MVLDLSMKLHSDTGTSTFFCDPRKVRNDEVPEKKKLRNTLSVLCKTQEYQPPVHSTTDFCKTVSLYFPPLLLNVGWNEAVCSVMEADDSDRLFAIFTM